MWAAIVGAVLSGLASRSEGKRQSADQRRNFKNELRLTDYQTRLVDHLQKEERQRMSKGWDTWTSGGPKPVDNIGTGPRLEDYLKDI